MDVVAASIPLFFLLIALEVLVSRRRGGGLYRLTDSIADLSLGILSQVSGIFIVLLSYAGFAWVGAHWSLQRLVPSLPAWPNGAPASWTASFPWVDLHWPALLSWTIVFLAVDLAYYWMHRLSHEVHLLWAGHVVHHSSEEYNLTVALRQSSLHGLLSWLFYLPLALVGVPWLMFAVCHGLNLIYQFWIHTRAVGRLGVLETFLNTPSHHRVHHGVNPEYQDRNYAGVLIIWDRMFRSFTPEREEPVYGITIPLASWNPVWANLHVFVEIARNAWRTRRWRDKLRVIFGPPSWRPADVGPSIEAPVVSKESFHKYDPESPAPVRQYVVVQFVAALLGALALLRFASSLPLLQVAAGGFYLVLTLSNVGSLLENNRMVVPLEYARIANLVLVSAALLAVPRFPGAIVAAIGLFGVVSAVWFQRIRPVVGVPPGAGTVTA